MERRIFLRNVSLAVVGGIFVPKFGRWFRPNGAQALALNGGLYFDDVPIIHGDFYVSPSGNDGNPGTAAQPWRTLQRAISKDSKVPAGSTVYLAPGEYSAPSTFLSYPLGGTTTVIGSREGSIISGVMRQ